LLRKASALPGLARRFAPLLTLGLFGYLEVRANWTRMRTFYDLALAEGDPADDLTTFGWLEHDRAIPDVEQGRLGPARRRLLRGLEVFEAANDASGIARCCSSLSHVGELLDQLDEAIEWGERGRAMAAQAGDQAALGTSQLVLGVLYNRVGRTAEAKAAFQASFDLAESSGHGRALARRRATAAASYVAAGRYDTAIEHLEVALNLFNGEVDDPIAKAHALQALSEAEFALGNHSQAEQHLREGLRLTDLHSDTHSRASLLASLATVQDAGAEPAAARQTRLEAIEIYETEGFLDAADELRRVQDAASGDGTEG
jgi:tetratricopeptide (TPR) repeat protein